MQGKISEFNNLFSYLCLAGSVLISWFLTQKGVSSNNLFFTKSSFSENSNMRELLRQDNVKLSSYCGWTSFSD